MQLAVKRVSSSVTYGRAVAAGVAAAKAGLLRTFQGDAVGVAGQLVPSASAVEHMALGGQGVKICAAQAAFHMQGVTGFA